MPTLSVRTPTSPSHWAADFVCRRADVGRVACVAVAGELDSASSPQLDLVLRSATSDAPVVVLDLRGLEFIDSSGAQLLIAADRRARRAGGRLIVIRGAEEVALFFALVGLDRCLEVVDNVPESLLLPTAWTGRAPDRRAAGGPSHRQRSSTRMQLLSPHPRRNHGR